MKKEKRQSNLTRKSKLLGMVEVDCGIAVGFCGTIHDVFVILI